MSHMAVEADGVTELVTRLDHAAAGITDLSDPNTAAARMVAVQATGGVPRATGVLANSQTVTVTGDGWGIGYGAAYAVPVHWGTKIMRARPWLIDSARDTEERWTTDLTDHVQQLLNGE